ncbi:MAG: hypothetical protein ACXW1S_10660 [Acidimicrobiia bacterium]
MRRKSRSRTDPIDEPRPGADSSNTAHDEFWAGAPAGDDEHLETLAGVIETDEQEMADETLEYMGSVPATWVEPDELVALGKWAESKACRACRKQIKDTHDPSTLKHDECRTALRVERLLRNYN